MDEIKNIYCVGRNYVAHAHELGNEVPSTPLLFMKPSHAATFAKLAPVISLPADSGAIHYEVELVVQLKTDYSPDRPLCEMIDHVALGIDFTLRDLQDQLKEKGLPWLPAKGFKDSAVLSNTIPFSSEADFNNLTFSLSINEKVVQQGTPQLMIFPLRTLLDYCWTHYGLKAGDLVFTGTPAGVGPTSFGDHFEFFIGSESLGSFTTNFSN